MGDFSFSAHPRDQDGTQYVYAVLSRRAGGISIGVNLNPDKACNFDCVYCQVDRSETRRASVDADRLATELEDAIEDANTGAMIERALAQGVPPALARVVEVAIAGDGEPTANPDFSALAETIAAIAGRCAPDLPLVLYTNATLLDRESVRRGVDAIVGAGGRVLAKLDAGTPATYRLIDRSAVGFDHVLANLALQSRRAPLWLQSMFIELDGQAPSEAEIAAFVGRLRDLVEEGGQLASVEVGTLARPPAVSEVGALPLDALEAIAGEIAAALPETPVQVVPGAAAPPAAE